MTATATAQTRAVFLDPARMKFAEYERNEWVANAQSGVTIDDVLLPEFWAHKAQEMRPYDRIEVRSDDETWIAELIVLRTDRTWAKVHMLNFYELDPKANTKVPETKNKVEWKGPQKKWCVIRVVDGAILKEGLDKSDAISWKENHERTVG